MAVWLVIWGRNPHNLNDEKVVEELKERIKKVELNFDFLAYNFSVNPSFDIDFDRENLTMERIKAYIKERQAKALPREDWIVKYNPENWKVIEHEDGWLGFTYYFYEIDKKENKYGDCFSFSLNHNIGNFNGVFKTFSSWNELSINVHENLRKGWLQVIRTLFRHFDITQLVYFSEWGFGYEDCEDFDELINYIEQHPERIVSEFEDFYDFQAFYLENLL